MHKALFFGLWLLANNVLAAPRPDPFPEVATSYLVELNGNTIWARQLDRHLPLASLTKLMTTLLVVEQAQPDDIVTVTPSAMHETGSRIGLRSGDVSACKTCLLPHYSRRPMMPAMRWPITLTAMNPDSSHT